MPKVLVWLVFAAALIGQVTTIPAPSGGGGGTIAAGRVAFGDGTSTPATDAAFTYSTADGLGIFPSATGGGFTSSLSGLSSYVTASNAGDTNSMYGVQGGSYHSGSGFVTGLLGAYFEAISASGTSNGDTYGISVLASSQGTSADVYGIKIQTNLTAGTADASYSLRTSANTGATISQSWDISAETGWDSRFLGRVAIGASNTATPTQTFYVKDATPTTGATTVQFDIGAGQSSTSTILTLGGVIRFNGQNTTGAGIASLGANSPAITNTAPYTWIRIVTSDGSTGYFPVWK